MTRICGILTLAVGMALAGCATDSVAWHDKSMDANRPTGINDKSNLTLSNQNPPDRSYSSNNNTANYPQGQHDMNSMASNSNGAVDSNTAQLGGGSDKNPAMGVSDLDGKFITDAAGSGLYEVNAGNRAMMKSSDAHVKMIAQHMVDDHTKANDQLQALASRKGMHVLPGMTSQQDNMIAQLDKLNGTDFDQEYLRQQKQAHQDAISEFQTAANSAHDKDLRDWAATTLPTLREHLAMINNQNSNNIGTER